MKAEGRNAPHPRPLPRALRVTTECGCWRTREREDGHYPSSDSSRSCAATIDPGFTSTSATFASRGQ